MSFSGVLKITNGTDSVTVIAKISGTLLDEWRAQTGQSQPLWSSSAFVNGRQMVMRKWNNIIDTFQIHVTGDNQDNAISNYRKLLDLLVDAGNYWIDEYQVGAQAIPVWIEALGDCETNTRYAYIYDGTIPELANPYTEPFKKTPSASDGMTLIVEHGVWRDNPPTEATCLEMHDLGKNIVSESYEPTQSADDAYIRNSAVSITINNTNNIGDDGASVDTGIRFRNVTIPPNSRVISAYVGLTNLFNTAPSASPPPYTDVYGESNIAPAQFTTYADFIGRTRTTAKSEFVMFPGGAAVVAGQVYWTFDISSIIQEIIDLNGWASGNDLVIFFENSVSGGGFTDELQYGSVDWAMGTEPVLNVTYIDEALTESETTLCEDNFAVSYNVNLELSDLRRYIGGVLSANLINGPFPVTLFNAPPAVNDELLIGADYPFTNVSFYLSNTGNGTVTYQVRYSTAAGYASGVMSDERWPVGGLFTNQTNQKAVLSFPRKSDWVQKTVSGITKYWIVIRITAVTVAPTNAVTQDVEVPYSYNWPYWDIPSESIEGDINALMRFLLIYYEAGTLGQNNKGLIGLRKYSRGANYAPYLNTRYNIANVAYTDDNGTAAASLYAPCGQAIGYTSGGATSLTRLGYWTISSYTVPEYRGRFRAFVRYYSLAGVSDILGFQIVSNINSETTIAYTDGALSAGHHVIDLGLLSLQPAFEIDFSSIQLDLYVSTDANETIQITDIILFPVDESVIEFSGTELFGFGSDAFGDQPYHDSTNPKLGAVTGLIDNYPDNSPSLTSTMITKSVGPFSAEPRIRNKLYIFTWNDTTIANKKCGVDGIYSIEPEKVQQYLNMRGDK